MCGRFARNLPLAHFAERLGMGTSFPINDRGARWNIAPGSYHLGFALPKTGILTTHDFRWGFRPHWAGEQAREVINARGETAATKPYFKRAVALGRRCLIPATAWYEWQKTAGGKQPYAITNDDKTLFFACLYTRGPDDLHNFAIVTRPAVKALAHVHDRMPLVLSDPKARDRWLAREPLPDGWLDRWVHADLLPDQWESWPVSREVNKPANDYPEVMERI